MPMDARKLLSSSVGKPNSSSKSDVFIDVRSLRDKSLNSLFEFDDPPTLTNLGKGRTYFRMSTKTSSTIDVAHSCGSRPSTIRQSIIKADIDNSEPGTSR